MLEFKYLELNPSCKGNKQFQISFEDTVKTASKKVKGVVNKNLIFVTRCYGDIQRVSGIKADIQVKLDLKSKIDLRDDILWSRFNDYRYCMIQLYKKKTIDLIAICNINRLGDIDIEDKRRSKVMTNEGEISLYDLCMDLKITASDKGVHGIDLIVNRDIFEGVEVTLFANTLYFIRRTFETEEILDSLATNPWIEIMRLLGMRVINPNRVE